MHKIGDDTPTADVNDEFIEIAPGPTDVRAAWMNSVQREMVHVVEQSGLVLNQADDTQVYQAIQRMIKEAQKRVIISDATFAAGVVDGDAVYWDDVAGNFDKAIADGTNKQQAVGFADVSNTNVYAFGDAPLLSGLTPGARYYLSTVTAGQITAVAPPPHTRVTVGIAKTATTLFVDIDIAQSTVSFSQMLVEEANGTNPSSQTVNCDFAEIANVDDIILFDIVITGARNSADFGRNLVISDGSGTAVAEFQNGQSSMSHYWAGHAVFGTQIQFYTISGRAKVTAAGTIISFGINSIQQFGTTPLNQSGQIRAYLLRGI